MVCFSDDDRCFIIKGSTHKLQLGVNIWYLSFNGLNFFMWIWCCQHILVLLHNYYKQKKAICICFDWFQLGGRGSVRDSGIGEDMHQQRCQQPHCPGQRHLRHQMLVDWVVNVSVHFKLKSSYTSYSEKQASGVYNKGVWGWGGTKDIPVTQVSECKMQTCTDLLTFWQNWLYFIFTLSLVRCLMLWKLNEHQPA